MAEEGMRISLLKREAAAFIKLRRLGYSISAIAEAFGRSTSIVYKRIHKAIEYGIIRFLDLRKMPNQTRRTSKALQWKRLLQLLPLWESWILGQGEKPP